MNELILNKINHKPLLIEKIFPYTINRPLIFQILLKSDISLKESLKIAFKSLKKNNNFDNETNEEFYRFIDYRLIFEKNLYEEYLINIDYTLKSLKNLSYYSFFMRYFNKIINDNLNPKYEINNNKAFNNFVLDYFQYHKKFCLYIFYDIKSNFELLKKFEYLEPDIDLIFFIYDCFSGIDDNIKSELIKQNLKVKNIYFAFVEEKNFEDKNIFKQLKEYIDIINNLKNKNDIKKINLKHLGTKENIIMNYLYENNLKINLEKLEKVEFDENKYLTIYDKFIHSYKLISIFNNKNFFNLIIITPEIFNNIKEINKAQEEYLLNKLNLLGQNNNNDNDLKIIFFDFKNNSPYQDDFIYFCEKYLSNIKNINTIVINNIGKTHYEIDTKKNIKKPLMNFNLLKNIICENKINLNNLGIVDEIREFIDLFFYTNNLLYKINTTYFLFYSNELNIFDIIDKNNIIFSYELGKLKIDFDNIIYEIYNKKELYIKKSKDIDINVINIKKTLKKLNKYFYMDLKGDTDLINQINSFNIDTNILKDKIQKDNVIKELGTLRTIFKVKKIFEGCANLRKIRQKIFNKKKVYKLGIFKTKESDIFGFFFKFNNNNNYYNAKFIYNFIFTTNTNIFNYVLDDEAFVKEGSLFVKEYTTEDEILKIKMHFKFPEHIDIENSEIYFLKNLIQTTKNKYLDY